MTRQHIDNTVMAVLMYVKDVDYNNPTLRTTPLKQLIDSLELVEFAIELERKFEIEINNAQLHDFENIGQVVDFICQRKAI